MTPSLRAIIVHRSSQIRSQTSVFTESSVLWVRYFLRLITRRLLGRTSEGPLTAVPTFVINLDTRPDRWLAISQHLKANGIAHSRFAGISHKAGLAGCALSHAAALRQGFEQGLPAMMILEDDAQFIAPTSEFSAVLRDFLENPALDVLCVAHVSRKPRPRVSQNLRVAQNVRTTAAYVVKRQSMGPLIWTFTESAAQIASGKPPEEFALDVLWEKLQKSSLLFAVPVAPLATQTATYSDIQKKFVDYSPEYDKSYS